MYESKYHTKICRYLLHIFFLLISSFWTKHISYLPRNCPHSTVQTGPKLITPKSPGASVPALRRPAPVICHCAYRRELCLLGRGPIAGPALRMSEVRRPFTETELRLSAEWQHNRRHEAEPSQDDRSSLGQITIDATLGRW